VSLRLRAAASLAMVLVGLTVLACRQERDPRPDIVLITIDTLRADHLSIYGETRFQTPHLDRLGREGLTFDAAYCDVTWTTASMASALTGTLPARHGVRSSYHRLSASNVTVAERLQEAGYATGAVIGSYPLSADSGIDQGFDVFDQELDTEGPLGARRSDAAVTEAALSLYEELTSGSKPVFLLVHYFGPHSRRVTSPAKMIAGYPDRVRQTDRHLGRLLEELPLRDGGENTLVILHADHGEGLGPGLKFGHGRHLYQGSLRVPLLLRWPARFPEPRRVQPPVGNVDLTPTLLDAAGVPFEPGEMDGRSLFEALGDPDSWPTHRYAETFLPAQHFFAEKIPIDGEMASLGVRRYGLVSERWKYVVTEPFALLDGAEPEVGDDVRERLRREELYDLERDPAEETNLADREPAVLGELRRELERLDVVAPGDLRKEARVLADDQLLRLRALGYVE
jgi:arylsulfatase A-like enzyme